MKNAKAFNFLFIKDIYEISSIIYNEFMESIITLLTPKKVTFYLNINSTIRQALEKFDAHRFTVVPLIDDEGKYCGTLSEGDLLRYIKHSASFNLKKLENVTISEIEHYRPYQALKIDASMLDVFALSQEQNFIPVTDDNDIFIGIIKRKEVIKKLFDDFSNKDK